MTITDFAQCGTCRTRIIWPETATGQRLPPVNWAPDPTGEMAVQHSATGRTWLGRWPERGEDVRFPEKRRRKHQCREAL